VDDGDSDKENKFRLPIGRELLLVRKSAHTIPRHHRVTAEYSFPGTTTGGATRGLPPAYLERPASSPPLTTLDVLEVPWFWKVGE
jgi:hypothetical protein